jgi:hypothetical protein
MQNGKNNGKVPVVSTIIAACCIILYIGALLYGALNIYNSITERRANGDKEFDDLADLASAASVMGFMDERYIQTIQDAVNSSETILGVIITGSRGEFAFERERGTVITWVSNSPRFVPRFATTNPPKYLPLRIEGQRNVNIQAVLGYLDYNYCIDILKRTLLLVLFALTLAFFTLLMDALLVKRGVLPAKEPNEEKAEENKILPEEEEVDEDLPDDDPIGFDEVAGDEDDAAVQEEPAFDFPPDDDDEPEFDMPDEDPIPDFVDEEIVPLTETAEETDDKAPQGLFSPRGNIGWEAYTEDRLESELHRCASAEQDLVFITMSFKEPGKLSKEQFRRFSDETVLFFEHRDLIFEYLEQGISVICPNYSLEQGFTMAEEFNSRIISRLPRSVGSRVILRFGISSRAGRLIDARRIQLEAGEALKRALADPESNIVAFKSDPEKYRQYISGHQDA